MTIEEKRAKLAERQEQERIKLEQEERIRAAIPEDLRTLPWSIHLSELYGRTVWLRLPYSRYRTSTDPAPPTLETVARIAAAFPEVVRMRRYKDYATSFQTAEYVASLPEEKTDNAEIMRAGSVMIKIDPAEYSQTCTLEWYTRIAGEVVTIDVEFPLYGEVARRVGTLDLRVSRYGGQGPIAAINVNRYAVDKRIDIIRHSRAYVITWASGSNETPGAHTVYWESGNIDESDVTILDVIERLRPIVEVRSASDSRDTYSVLVNDREVVVQESYTVAHTIAEMVRKGIADTSECGEVAQGILDALRTDPHVAPDDQELYGADAAQVQADRRREDQP